MAITLKKYQETSLEILRNFLELSRFEGAKQAYEKVQTQRYRGEYFKPFQPLKDLEETPYICLRLPTGGGKTLLSAHTIALAGKHYLENDYPLTLWLVPTNTIKEQTLETFKNSNHANYQVLEKFFGGKFRVFDIGDFRTIRPQDISGGACVIISTFASLRVDKTDGRKAYDHDENLETHFSKIPSSASGMEFDENGQIKFSFANLLNWHRPLVIVDEAHNAKTDLSVEVLRRVNASCVIEYTATPAPNSNIICSVSAAELKAEQMIKLPIILTENKSWQEAVSASIQTRRKLEDLALKDKDYIRPIVLFQSESKDQEVTTEVLEKYLVENEGISRNQIAIATGDQKELDGINLLNPNCEIRFIITVQALKEGWDCSFAYVLCSVANTQSSTAIEQLLGRVLRMPYAKERSHPDLNKAYANVTAKGWKDPANQMCERLVNMGFEKLEAQNFVDYQPSLPAFDAIATQPFEVILEKEPDLSGLDIVELAAVSVEKKSDNSIILKLATGFTKISEEKLQHLAATSRDQEALSAQINAYKARQENFKNKIGQKELSPSQRGEVFCLPQLCLNFDGEIELAEVETCLDVMGGWGLLDYPTTFTKSDFAFNDESKQYALDIAGQKLAIKPLKQIEQLSLEGIRTEMGELDLCRWLDRKLQASQIEKDIGQEFLLEFVRRSIHNLLARDDLDMAKLSRDKFILEKFLREKINSYRKEAATKSYQSCLFGKKSFAAVSPKDFNFSFSANYPANLYYQGRFVFEKHYYPLPGDMSGEEAECASKIDQNKNVKCWVRNVECQPKYSFWLPVSGGKFYPDFVAQLNCGRFLIIEYKGSHLDNSETAEKELIGKKWAEESGNLFLMSWKKDDSGNNVEQQINKIINS